MGDPWMLEVFFVIVLEECLDIPDEIITDGLVGDVKDLSNWLLYVTSIFYLFFPLLSH